MKAIIFLISAFYLCVIALGICDMSIHNDRTVIFQKETNAH